MTPTPTDPVAAAARWYARTHADLPAGDEAARLDAWIRADAAHADAWEQVSDLDAALGQVSADPAIAALRAEALGAAPGRWRPMLGWAAAAALVAGVGTLTFIGLDDTGVRRDAPASPAMRYATTTGEIRAVTLPDGSTMTLDARSAARVAQPGARRAVTVESGRALFAVAKDKAHPFVVTIAGTQVTALGTHFSVERRGTRTVVALVEGSVRVVTPAGTRTLKPDQVLITQGGTIAMARGADAETGWTTGRLTFSAVPLGEVAATVNRYGGRQVVIRDAALAARPYSGSLRTTGGGDALVAALTATGAARVTARDETSVTLGR